MYCGSDLPWQTTLDTGLFTTHDCCYVPTVRSALIHASKLPVRNNADWQTSFSMCLHCACQEPQLHNSYVHLWLVHCILLGIVSYVLALKEHADLTECWPLGWLTVPALPHQVIDLARTGLRLREAAFMAIVSVVVTTVLKDVLIREFVEGLLAGEGQHLP